MVWLAESVCEAARTEPAKHMDHTNYILHTYIYINICQFTLPELLLILRGWQGPRVFFFSSAPCHENPHAKAAGVPLRSPYAANPVAPGRSVRPPVARPDGKDSLEGDG